MLFFRATELCKTKSVKNKQSKIRQCKMYVIWDNRKGEMKNDTLRSTSFIKNFKPSILHSKMNKAALQARQLLISLCTKCRRNGIKQKHWFFTVNIKAWSFIYGKTTSLFPPFNYFLLFYSHFSSEPYQGATVVEIKRWSFDWDKIHYISFKRWRGRKKIKSSEKYIARHLCQAG